MWEEKEQKDQGAIWVGGRGWEGPDGPVLTGEYRRSEKSGAKVQPRGGSTEDTGRVRGTPMAGSLGRHFPSEISLSGVAPAQGWPRRNVGEVKRKDAAALGPL